LADPVLDIAGLAKRYGASTVFEHVDLVLGAGEFVAVVGESGVGKSTLLNCAAGLDTIDAGRVRVAGTDINALGESAQAVFRRHHLGFVFQAFHVLPHLTVAANVGLPLLLQHAPDPARVTAMLILSSLIWISPRATGWLLARIHTSSVALASSGITAPRPMRSSCDIGSVDRPRTTEISTLTDLT
jgi:putative ABC transport system ATP-binding protein